MPTKKKEYRLLDTPEKVEAWRKSVFYDKPGRVFIGHGEYSNGYHPHTTHYAIEVPEEHAEVWLAHVKGRIPGAYLSKTWTKNGTLMQRYDGTPDNKVVLDHGDT